MRRLDLLTFLLLVVGGAVSLTPVRANEPPSSRYGAVRRMALERLAAARADVERLRARRRALSELPVTAATYGLRDFRAILHAHAEDSAHTGGTLPEMLRDAAGPT